MLSVLCLLDFPAVDRYLILNIGLFVGFCSWDLHSILSFQFVIQEDLVKYIMDLDQFLVSSVKIMLKLGALLLKIKWVLV